MSPNGPTQTELEAGSNLVGGMQAVRVVMARLEQQAARVIWEAKPQDRSRVVQCVMEAAKAFSAALKECKDAVPTTPQKPQGQPGGEGPDCDPGYHEEFGICVPDV